MNVIEVLPGENAKFTTVRREHLEALTTEAERYRTAYNELHGAITSEIPALTSDIVKLNEQHAAELAALRDDYTAQGEALEASKERVAELDALLKIADASIKQFRTKLADAEQSLAIERRNVQLLNDQLRAARNENSDLHVELAKARQGVKAS